LAHARKTKNDVHTVQVVVQGGGSFAFSVAPLDGRVFPVTANAVMLSSERSMRHAGTELLHRHDLRPEAASYLPEKLCFVVELSAETGHKDLIALER
jgi:hypothetical protein